MNVYVDVVLWKIRTLFRPKFCKSVLIFGSKIDRTVALRQNVHVFNSTVGRYTYIIRNSLIQNTEIGSFCSIGGMIGMPKHPINMVSTSPVFLEGKNVLRKNFANISFKDVCPKTIIEDGAWVATDSKVMSGVRIGEGAIVGAGSIVTKDVPPYAIVAGVPAKFIKYRFDEETRKALHDSKWWEMSERDLYKYGYLFDNAEKFMERLRGSLGEK